MLQTFLVGKEVFVHCHGAFNRAIGHNLKLDASRSLVGEGIETKVLILLVGD